MTEKKFIDEPSLSLRWLGCLLVEVIIVISLGVLAFYLLRAYSTLGILNDRLDSIVRYVVVLSPILAAYFLARIFLSIPVSLVLITLLQVALIFINNKKISETQEPLSWGDLTGLGNYRIAIHYIDWVGVSIILSGILILFLLLIFFQSKNKPRIISRLVFIFLSCIAVIFAAPQYIEKLSPALAYPAINFYNKNISEYYFSYNWPANQMQNGIYTHLVQTSVRPIPKKATDVEQAIFDALPKHSQTEERPKHIIFILCEACWHDDVHFTELFQPLRDEGLTELRGVSPAYGGGTANAEFEMYTALSSRAVLQGVLFQEYASEFSTNSETMVSALQGKNYRTLAFHNFNRKFWKRDVVLKKFGFEGYRGIEDMADVKTNKLNFPLDSVLFEDALNVLKDNIDQPFFASLLTVSTHGSYTKVANDKYGIEDYKRRLKQAISDTAIFVREIKRLDPDVLLVLYGDHKPALTEFFYAEGILDKASNDWEKLGDVPIYIAYSNKSIIDKIKAFSNNLPFYCIAAAIDELSIKSGSTTTKFVFDNICSNPHNYNDNLLRFPSWLYRLTLFD